MSNLNKIQDILDVINDNDKNDVTIGMFTYYAVMCGISLCFIGVVFIFLIFYAIIVSVRDSSIPDKIKKMNLKLPKFKKFWKNTLETQETIEKDDNKIKKILASTKIGIKDKWKKLKKLFKKQERHSKKNFQDVQLLKKTLGKENQDQTKEINILEKDLDSQFKKYKDFVSDLPERCEFNKNNFGADDDLLGYIESEYEEENKEKENLMEMIVFGFISVSIILGIPIVFFYFFIHAIELTKAAKKENDDIKKIISKGEFVTVSFDKQKKCSEFIFNYSIALLVISILIIIFGGGSSSDSGSSFGSSSSWNKLKKIATFTIIPILMFILPIILFILIFSTFISIALSSVMINYHKTILKKIEDLE